MSTTQGPYRIEQHYNHAARELTEYRYLVNDDGHRLGPYTSDYEAELALGVANAAYAAGQSSKQAELDEAYMKLADAEARAEHNAAHGIKTREKLDKAVELLRAFANADEWVEGVSMVFMPQSEWDKMNAAMLAARAYLTTLNPQPDAAQ